MLDNEPFYWHTTRNLVIAFADVFNGIQITKEDSDGVTQKTLQVPISMMRKLNWLTRLREDVTAQEEKSLAAAIELSLPRMTYDITGIEPNAGNRLNPFNIQARKIDTVGVHDYLRQMSGTPVTMSFELSIYTKNIDQMLQIIEQIIPFFVPDFNVNILDIPELDLRKDVPIKLETITAGGAYEGDMEEYDIIEWALGFTCDIEIYPPVREGGVIRRVINDVKTSNVKVAVNIDTVIDPFDAKETDDYDIITTITDEPNG